MQKVNKIFNSTPARGIALLSCVCGIISFIPNAEEKIDKLISIFEPKLEVVINNNQSNIPPSFYKNFSTGINALDNPDSIKRVIEDPTTSTTEKEILNSALNILEDPELNKVYYFYKEMILNGFDSSIVTIKNNSEENISDLSIYLKGVYIHDHDCHQIDKNKNATKCTYSESEVFWRNKNGTEIVTVSIPSKEAYKLKLYGDINAIDVDLIKKGEKINFKETEIVDIKKDWLVNLYKHHPLRLLCIILAIWYASLFALEKLNKKEDDTIDKKINDAVERNSENTKDKQVQRQLKQDTSVEYNPKKRNWKESIKAWVGKQ